ncbi:MAG TPA: aldehyde dehydrogenase [Firmicutes bacterium]|nr:aldehyde dehydrogenase [Bacillota bacterium]
MRIPEDYQRPKVLIGGQWRYAADQQEFNVVSPVTGEVVAKVPLCGERDADEAVEAAAKSWPEFKLTPPRVRSDLCRLVSHKIMERKEAIAEAISLEQGKSYHWEALAEVEEAATNFRLAAEDIMRLESPVVPMNDPNKRFFTLKEAVGVMVVITPWNFPVVIPSEYLGPGLAAGNTIVFKPASATPISALMMCEAIHAALVESGLKPSIFSVVTGPGSRLGAALISHPKTAIVGFTGETVTGESVARQAGIKRALMELGGNGPQIVCEDANLQEAAKAAAFGSFYNSGQVCCATERILVHAKIHDEFMGFLLEEAGKYEVGDPFEESVMMGPMTTADTIRKVKLHLKDAVDKGARILLGGEVLEGKRTDHYFPATVVDNVAAHTLLNTEETFGPVAPVILFNDDDEAIAMANASGYGLQMSVFTSSIKKLYYYAERLRTGNVVFNDSTDYWEAHEPFGGGGGTKSGYGRLGGRFTLDDVTHLKSIAIDINKVR